MNIYFACSITGGREFETVYQQLVSALLADGHELPTAHLAESNVMHMEQIIGADEVYARDIQWIRGCDVLIAEVSVPSHGVGYEIAYALNLGKPVLCLSQQGRKVSKMITGNPDEKLKKYEYVSVGDAIKISREFIANH